MQKKMNKKIILISAIVLIVLLVLGGYYLLLNQPMPQEPKNYTGPTEKIVFGVETSLLPSLVWIAENQSYFSEQGLDVEIKEFDSGRNALKTMLEQGNLDMVTVAQTPIMFNSFNKNDYAIIGTMVTSKKDVKILARKDKGINKPEDLKGKKIGTTKGSTGHYFLSLFLSYNSISISEVDVLDFKATELPQAIANGSVDAISTWEPNIYNAKKQLGEQAIFLSDKEVYREDFYFVSNKNFIKNNSYALERFLKAIKKAEEFIQKNKTESINIVSKRLKLDKEFTTSVWDDFNFNLFLDQTVFSTLEDEAKWAILNNLTNATEVPNYLNYIYPDALKKVKPEAVTIIGE